MCPTCEVKKNRIKFQLEFEENVLFCQNMEQRVNNLCRQLSNTRMLVQFCIYFQ